MRTAIRWRRLAALTAGVASGGLVLAVGAAQGAGPGSGSSVPSPIVYTTSQVPLVITGQSDLSSGAASTVAAASPLTVPPPGLPQLVVPLLLPPHSGVTANAAPAAKSSSGPTAITPGTYPKTVAFPGISGQQSAAAEGYYLEPPDQGLCVGGKGGPNATVIEFINNTLQAFSPTGTPESQVIPSAQLFDLPADAFLSDPRCYWDRDTSRWYFQEFTSGIPATQYIAVSQTSDALGKYTVFQFDTTDASAPPASNCPCFGDFDQQGADNNGYYIATNEFSNVTGQFNGADIWAMSKEQLAQAADSKAAPPPVDRYAVTSDQFGLPYHVSPADTPPDGAYFHDTEFFVESNSDANSDNHLLVYDMTNTQLLDSGGFPSLAASSLTTQGYSAPPNANQPAGICPTCTVDADFNAVQEVTEAHGTLYAELDSGTPPFTQAFPGTGPAQAEWFILDAKQNKPQSVALDNQGVVSNPNDSFLYPDIAVDGAGNGFMLFSVSGADFYPSPGYIAFDKHNGPSGSALLPAQGVNDEDGFTCYPPFGILGSTSSDCRWGDYSMGVAFDQRIFMAAEYIPPPGTPTVVNWGTYMWNAPPK
jgi:hypothetical protein